jgi:hypothetical protein
MKKYIFFILIITIFDSCNSVSEETLDKISFNSNLSNSNKVVLRVRKPNQNELSRNDSCFERKPNLKLERKSTVEDFKYLFSNSTYSGYCCCPESTMLIEFYNDSEKIETYFMETIESKDSVRIFEKSYQYSFRISKSSWNEFLTNKGK